MKILVISNLYPPFQLGGYEIGCKNVVAGLRQHNHEVHVLTSPSHAPEDDRDNKVFRLLKLAMFQPVNPISESVKKAIHLEAMVTNFTNTSILLNKIKEFKPDCVFCFNLVGIGGLALLDSLNVLNYPWVLYLGDVVPATLQSEISTQILSLYNAHNGSIYENGKIILISKHLHEEIESKCRYKITNFELIPGWAKPDGPILDRCYYSKDKVNFVSAGALYPHKGIDIIIEAAEKLKASYIENFSIEIYGNGLLNHYVDLCKQLGVSDKITFGCFKTQPELIEIYKKSDAFLFPTWIREPFGLAPIEAASVGCVPIITSSCGVAERLVGGVHCLKIPRDSNALSEMMRSICERKVDLRTLGKNGQRITREDLSFELCLKKIQSCLYCAAERINTAKLPSWSDINLAYLKHNLANEFLNVSIGNRL